MSRTVVAFRMGVRAYRRTPVLLVLLLVLPAYAIGAFRWVAPETAVEVHLTEHTVTTGLTDLIGALTTPLVCAFVGGFAGLFVMRTTRAADARLIRAGYRPTRLVAERLLLLSGVGGLITVISTATAVLLGFTPESLGWFVFATLLVALVYGLYGALVGTAFDRLAGVYLLLFGPVIDLFLFHNPLATEPPAGAVVLPGHFPLALAMDSAFTTGVSDTVVGGGLGYLAMLAIVTAGAFYQSMRGGR